MSYVAVRGKGDPNAKGGEYQNALLLLYGVAYAIKMSKRGVRRSGKSELMKAFSASVALKDPSSNNVYIDQLGLDNEPLLEHHALHREIIERHKEGTRNRLFIDEVQLCEGFEKTINSIHAHGGWDVYLTGSNAFLLSSDLVTLFTGRHREVHILPSASANTVPTSASKGPSTMTSTLSSDAAGSLGPTITMTSRSRTATSAMSTRPSSRAISFKSSPCPTPPC